MGNNNKLEHISLCKGIAMVMIIIVHSAQPFSGMPRLAFYPTIYGQMGTQLFFVISGYLMSTHMNKQGVKLYPKYLRRKYIRFVVPLFVAAVIYYALYVFNQLCFMAPIYEPHYSVKNIVLSMFLLQQLNFTEVNFLVPGSWYIGCLWIFYLIFPFLNKLISSFYSRSRKYVYVFCFLLNLILIIIQSILDQHYNLKVGNNTSFYFLFTNQLPSLLIGMKLYLDETTSLKTKNNSLVLFLLWTFITLGIIYVNMPWSFVLCITTSSISFAHLFVFIRDRFAYSAHTNITGFLARMGDCSLGIYFIHFALVWYIPSIVLNQLMINDELILLLSYIGFLLLSLLVLPYLGEYFIKLTNRINKIIIRDN